MTESTYTIAPNRKVAKDCRYCESLQRKVRSLEGLIGNGVTLDARTRRSVQVLHRRIVFLEARAAVMADKGVPTGFDDIESAAIKWAILCIDAARQWGVALPEAPDLDAVAWDARAHGDVPA